MIWFVAAKTGLEERGTCTFDQVFVFKFGYFLVGLGFAYFSLDQTTSQHFEKSEVGKIPIGDATGGAVRHIGGDVNYTARDARLKLKFCSNAINIYIYIGQCNLNKTF